ncbi:hypothetical protein VSDG_06298 [Cytospora chrysosperma]|uniref:Pre-mRNA-splicing factor SPF27 n=1 Tax=Cytospora chrysosperma TaxID=252740 RepID=A0A423VSL0_CYTCH|nr:hypothetical protein VSDG_06298 [Valsa sordida]
MPSITTVHESLPYIDPEPTPEERAAAEALISLERAAVADDPHHALLPPPASPSFTPAIQAELDRIAASPDPTGKPAPLRAVDLARYEAPELGDPAAAGRDELAAALSQAYTAMAYLGGRRQNLALLDTYGRNAWLVGNWHLEAELKALEREVAGARREIDLVTIRRQRVQEEVGGEIRGLEDTWRRGVGRVLETEVAAEGLRREILEVQRAQAEA